MAHSIPMKISCSCGAGIRAGSLLPAGLFVALQSRPEVGCRLKARPTQASGFRSNRLRGGPW